MKLKQMLMTNRVRTLATALVGLFFVTAGTLSLNSQVTREIPAHLDHSFVIGNTTFPPGDYTFRMVDTSDLSAMSVTGENDKITEEFLVREAIDDHMPNHSDLVFRKYGNTEFLSKVFQAGSKYGEEVTETSRQEAHFAKQGQHATEHTEEQK